MGFFAVSSQQMAPKIPRKASTPIVTMNFEPNQSSSSPRSIMIWRQPSPSEMSERPMKSIPLVLRFCFSFSHGGSSTRSRLRNTAATPNGMLTKKIQRQVEVSVM